MSDNYKPFASGDELLELIKSVCAAGRTGTLFAISEINSLAKMVIVAGNIIYLEYRLKKGAEAIPLLLEIENGSYDFKDGKVVSHKAVALPSTAEILAMLGGAPIPATPAAASASVAARPTTSTFSLIEEHLTEVLGPMASFIWEEHLDKVGGAGEHVDVLQLVERLAGEIDDPNKAARFRSTLFAALGA